MSLCIFCYRTNILPKYSDAHSVAVPILYQWVDVGVHSVALPILTNVDWGGGGVGARKPTSKQQVSEHIVASLGIH